jgi:hypothetical protein
MRAAARLCRIAGEVGGRGEPGEGGAGGVAPLPMGH